LNKGAIREVAPHPQQFVSTLFLVEKSHGTGEFRPVINLKALNRFLPREKFRMEGLQTARSLLRSGDFMMKLDLKDAYYAIPVHEDSQKFLRFVFEGRMFEFQCLPFGLSSAPRTFTKMVHPVVARLRSEGLIYLDDLLIIHQREKTLRAIFHCVVELLTNLGFIVKPEKCSPAPTQQLIFLGAVIDTTQMTISLPDEKLQTIVRSCQQLSETRMTSVKELSCLLGRMSHAAQTGVWLAPLHYRSLQRLLAQTISRLGWSPKTMLQLSAQALKDLEWWLSPTLKNYNSHDINPPPFDMMVQTDASLLGWGATCNGQVTGGRWSSIESQQHINCLELKAALFALQAFLRRSTDPPRHILLEMDNTTAVSYVNRRGGTCSSTLSLLALDLWSFFRRSGTTRQQLY
jgi:hypothetical protein